MPPDLENKSREELAWEIVRMREERILVEGGREELAQEIVRVREEKALLEGGREELALEIVRLRHQVSDLNRMLFGQSSERFEGGKQEGSSKRSEGGSGQKAPAKPRKNEPAKPVKVHPGRAPLPESLERREVIIEPEEQVEGMKCIGEEITEERKPPANPI